MKCPVCNSTKTREVIQWKDDYSINKCDICDSLFSSPIPSEKELSEFYQGFLYRQPDIKKMPGLIAKKKCELSSLFKLTKNNIYGKTFLDYGGGTGVAFMAAKELGLDAFFHEIDEKAVDFVKTQFGAEDSSIITQNHDFKGKAFDFILADNVIEHSPDPVAFVRFLYSMLNPNGTLVIKTPHAGNTEMLFYPKIAFGNYFRVTLKYNAIIRSLKMLFNDRTWACDPPRHLFGFSKKSFEEIAQSLGMAEEDFKIKFYNIATWEYSVAKSFMSKPKNLKGIAKRFIAIPLIAIEALSKLLQYVCVSLKLVSAGGLILQLHRRPAAIGCRL